VIILEGEVVSAEEDLEKLDSLIADLT